MRQPWVSKTGITISPKQVYGGWKSSVLIVVFAVAIVHVGVGLVYAQFGIESSSLTECFDDDCGCSHGLCDGTGSAFWDGFDCGFLARGYYLNDQRLQWTGLEATCGAEGVLTPTIKHNSGCWETKVEGEFYINQPFNRNILVDNAERQSYVGNFDVETFEISQLALSIRRGNIELTVGKMVTPFGRTCFPLYTNSRIDAPFIRTEAILWRETGLLIRYDPGYFVGEVAITNGCEDCDTNSSKALVSRIGIKTDWLAAGFSVKIQDGIGSETQKQYNSHVGVDFMIRYGRFTLSGEAIYDEYGFRRPGFDPLDITWGRSLYYRDQNYKMHKPITGVGYYVNIGYENGPWDITLNYGEYYPQELGDPQHDVTNRRGIVKVAYNITQYFKTYTVLMMETDNYLAQCGRLRRGGVLLTGLEYEF